jgi:hypothetical protein
MFCLLLYFQDSINQTMAPPVTQVVDDEEKIRRAFVAQFEPPKGSVAKASSVPARKNSLPVVPLKPIFSMEDVSAPVDDTPAHLYKKELAVFPTLKLVGPNDFPLTESVSRRAAEDWSMEPTSKVAVMVACAAEDYFGAYLRIRFFEVANYKINKLLQNDDDWSPSPPVHLAGEEDNLKAMIGVTPIQFEHFDNFQVNFDRILSEYNTGDYFDLKAFRGEIEGYLDKVPLEQLRVLSNIPYHDGKGKSVPFHQHFFNP